MAVFAAIALSTLFRPKPWGHPCHPSFSHIRSSNLSGNAHKTYQKSELFLHSIAPNLSSSFPPNFPASILPLFDLILNAAAKVILLKISQIMLTLIKSSNDFPYHYTISSHLSWAFCPHSLLSSVPRSTDHCSSVPTWAFRHGLLPYFPQVFTQCRLLHGDVPSHGILLLCFIFLPSTPYHSHHFNYLSGFSLATHPTTSLIYTETTEYVIEC